MSPQELKKATAERQAMLLKTGAAVAKSVATILDPDVLMRQTVDTICDAFGFYYAGVFLLDDAGEYAVLRAGRGEAGAAMVAEGHKLKVGGTSMIGAATSLREARIALDVGEEPVFFRNPHLPGTRSEMGLPLVMGDEVIGALTVQSTEEAAFTTEDITALQAMADQLAIAIQNARLHQENQRLLAHEQRQSQLLRAANEVGKQVASILDLDELLPRMVEIIVEAYGFYYAGVFLIDELGEFAVLRAGFGEPGAAMLAAGHKLEVGGNSMIGAACQTKAARIALDVGEEAVFFRNPHLPNTRSEMALPMIVNDRVLGAVTVQSEHEAAFSEEDVSSLQNMADHLAVAVENAQLLNALAEANAELLRTKTYEALATATTEAIHWIGNKALPMSLTIGLIQDELGQGGEVDLDSLKEDLALIADGARLIVQVKENLLGPARETRPRPTMVTDVLETAALQAGLTPDQFTLTVDADEEPMAIGDATQLARAFGNLMRNAMEANARHVFATVGIEEELGYVSIEIRDDGDGIPSDIQDKVWATFFSTKGPEHTGLGLPAVLHIVTQLDGHMSMQSVEGAGTSFSLLLPMSTRKPGSARFGPTPARVVLVDDDDRWAAFVRDTLAAAGKQVTVTTDVDEMADADLLLVDDALRAEPVVTFLKRLAKARLIGRALVLTAALSVERTTEYMRLGARDVQQKPYTASDLSELLDLNYD